MAIRVRDLYVPPAPPTPKLSLVPAPPRRGNGPAAIAFVLVLCAVLGGPVVSAALKPPPEMPLESPRGPAAVAIMELDRWTPLPDGDVPRTMEPTAAMAFVRCTRLWTAGPDGTGAEPLLEVTGLSSPAVAPDGRTIAFLRTESGVQSLWLTAADGSGMRKVGTFGAAMPEGMRVGGLAWAPDGRRLAFALSDGMNGPMTGGSSVWTLDLGTGKFQRIGGGWPAPFWYGEKLMFARGDEAPDMQLTAIAGRRLENQINSSEDDLAAAVVPQGWWNNTRNGTAILRADGNEMHLAVRNLWRDRDRVVLEPPNGYRFARFAQPAITQDGGRIAIDLLDPGAGRDIGLVDPKTGEWTILDYAWEPSTSPTPTITGPLERGDARTAADMLFANWHRRPQRSELLSIGDFPNNLFPWRYFGWVLHDPYQTEGRWIVPALAYSYGTRSDPYGYRTMDIVVRRVDGRLTATPTNVSELVPIDSVADAYRFAEVATGRDLPELPQLPPGTKLWNQYALSAGSWNGHTSTTINTKAPPMPGTKGQREMSFSFGDGDNIDFSLGCGGAVDPDPVEVAGIPAMIDRSGSIRQVIWPATPDKPSGSMSVHGTMTRDELLELAEAVATQ